MPLHFIYVKDLLYFIWTMYNMLCGAKWFQHGGDIDCYFHIEMTDIS